MLQFARFLAFMSIMTRETLRVSNLGDSVLDLVVQQDLSILTGSRYISLGIIPHLQPDIRYDGSLGAKPKVKAYILKLILV